MPTVVQLGPREETSQRERMVWEVMEGYCIDLGERCRIGRRIDLKEVRIGWEGHHIDWEEHRTGWEHRIVGHHIEVEIRSHLAHNLMYTQVRHIRIFCMERHKLKPKDRAFAYHAEGHSEPALRASSYRLP